MKVKITKIGESKNGVKSGDWRDYIVGEDNGKAVSLPLNYVVEGELLRNITKGSNILVRRTKRNGVEIEGVFESSPVFDIKNNLISTQNSIYQVEYINDKDLPAI